MPYAIPLSADAPSSHTESVLTVNMIRHGVMPSLVVGALLESTIACVALYILVAINNPGALCEELKPFVN